MATIKSKYDSGALCPFWIEADARARSIRCEGYLRRCANLSRFQRKKDFENHIRRRCCADFQSCPLFRIVWEKNMQAGDAK